MRNITALLLGSALLSLWPTFGNAATLPTLPQAFVNTTYSLPTTGTTFTPANSLAFQTALNNAQLGDVIVLTAGTTYTGPFTLPNKSGSGWIYIQSSAISSLPAAGTRVSPANAANMPKIVIGANLGAVIQTQAQAHHYRFVGIEFRPVANNFVFNLIQIGNNESQLSNLPNNIVFDRCYVHGDSTVGGRRGIVMNGNSIAVIDSHISDFKENGADTQAIWASNGAGPFKIVNNFLEASGENILFGGQDPTISNLVPSDIEIRRNHFFKPLTWIGSGWTVKNLLEFKNSRRVLVEGNIFENNWLHAQDGEALVITPRNQNNSAPWSTTEDITFRLNKIINVGKGVNIAGTDDNFSSQRTSRVLIENNVIQTTALQGATGRVFQIIGGPLNITIRHNTGFIINAGSTAVAENSPKADQFDFRDNMLSNGTYGFIGTNTAPGTSTLNGHFSNYTFLNNAIIGGGPAGSYPPNNFFPANIAAVQFVNYAGGDYRLSASSPFTGAASDGTDVGANINLLEAAISGIGGGKVLPPQKLRVTN